MSPSDVVAFLRSWSPGESTDQPSPEGVGRQLQAAAKERPGEFAAAAGELIGLPPTYVHISRSEALSKRRGTVRSLIGCRFSRFAHGLFNNLAAMSPSSLSF